MARGKQQHQDYLDALSALGKDLARRARSRCELSGEPGSLHVVDLEGPDRAPSLDHIVLVSRTVRDHLEGRQLESRGPLRYLEEAAWHSEPAVRRAACRVLEQIEEPWAKEALDNAKSMDGYT